MSYLFKYYYKQYDKFMSIFKLDKNNAIINALGNVNSLNILDIGGGTGTLASSIINLGGVVTIVDPEVKMTDVAKLKNTSVNIVNSFADNIPLESSSIDLIVIRDAFHHIIEKEKALNECKRLLKPNGRLLIYEFEKSHIITKLIFIFEKSCFEKVKMLSKIEMETLASPYFKKINIVKVSNYEYIYLGVAK